MIVKTKDMDESIHKVMVSFRMVGLVIDYPTTELILETLEHFEKMKGSFDLKTAAKIQVEHQKKWEKYSELTSNVTTGTDGEK